jgi:flagellin
MTRINTNLSSLTAQHTLGRTNRALESSLTRLSTGFRINSGKDDPAGLTASEVLRSEAVAIRTSISNSERANNIVATADSALAEVSTLLNDIRGLVQASANKGALSDAEIAANQVQLDSALESIERIGQTTVFGGEKLLNGSKAFSLSSATLNSFNSVSDIVVHSFDPALHVAGADVTINVDTEASRRTLVYTGTGGANDLNDLTAAANTTLELIGDNGRAVITVDNDDVIADTQALVSAVNAVTSQTGITATKAAGADGNVTFTSAKYGSAATITVNVLAGDATSTAVFGAGAATAGVDVQFDITHANGGASNQTGVGEVITYSDSSISLTATTDPSLAAGANTFDVTGGALFQIGPTVNYVNQVNVNITGLDLATLGRNITTTGTKGLSALKTGGSDVLSSDDLTDAAQVVGQAINHVATLRGRLGALQKNVLESNIRSLQTGLEQVTAAESSIRDADFAAETAALTRSQILVQAGTSVLAIANSSPQNVLALLQ